MESLPGTEFTYEKVDIMVVGLDKIQATNNGQNLDLIYGPFMT